MPMYDVECPSCGNVEEVFCSYKEVDAQKCLSCDKTMTFLPTFWYTGPRAEQRFTPVVIHRDAEGNVRFPGRADAKVPEGFTKVELSDVSQIRAFEKEQNSRGEVEAGKFQASKNFLLEGQLKENRRVMDEILRGGSWTINGPDGEPITRHGFTERGRAFYESMRKASERQSHGRVSPEFVVEAFSQDSSNRVQHMDRRDGAWERDRK